MKECKRILQVVSVMNRGGVESMLMSLYRNIDREKIQFDFVVHYKNGDFEDEIRNMGGKIYYAPNYKLTNNVIYKKWWNDFFKSHKEYKIIHSHTYAIASIQLKIAKKYGLTTIVHSHNTSTGKGLKGMVKQILQRNIKNIPQYLFACSDKAGEWLYGKDCRKRDNYFLLKNAINIDKYVFCESVRNKIRKEFNIEDKLVLGHVGRFNEQKNHRFLIRIFREIVNIHPESVLLLVGDGCLRGEIEETINRLNVADKVIMTGVRSDVNEILQAMDCFVFPSLYEGLPVTVVEAQAAGLPCFISDRITDEVVVTDNIELISIDGSADVWVDAILEKTSNFKREDTSQKIIDAGYDIKTTTEWLTDFYMNN